MFCEGGGGGVGPVAFELEVEARRITFEAIDGEEPLRRL